MNLRMGWGVRIGKRWREDGEVGDYGEVDKVGGGGGASGWLFVLEAVDLKMEGLV